MNADQLARLALACLATATLIGMFGHSIPYVAPNTVSSIKGNLQDIGIFAGCLAYWLR